MLESELGFLRYLQKAKVPLHEYEFPESKLANIQTQLQNLIEKNYFLNVAAKDAFRSNIQAYASHSQKMTFDVHKLDLIKLAKAFGLSAPPKVNLNVKLGGRNAR